MTGTILPVRPTARGLTLLIVTLLLLALGGLTGLAAARGVAGLLLVALALCLVCTALALVGLRLRRAVRDETVSAPGLARVDLELAPGALVRHLPLARGVVHCELPDDLGGPGDLPLAPAMGHHLPVARRGVHPLGRVETRVRDVLGLFEARRAQDLPGSVIGLPVIEEVDADLVRRAGLDRRGTPHGAVASGLGEIGPLARPYVEGDDLRRVHWRASAKVGTLMTREDEPAVSQTAVVIIDGRRRGALDLPTEDRLVAIAASLWSLLRSRGWAVRVLDARGDEIVHAAAESDPLIPGAEPLIDTRAAASVIARETDAVEVREALVSLARFDFTRDGGHERRSAGGVTTGDVALAIVVAPDDAGPGESGHRAADREQTGHGGVAPVGGWGRVIDLEGLCGRAGRRLALLVSGRADTSAERLGSWVFVHTSRRSSVADALEAAAEEAS